MVDVVFKKIDQPRSSAQAKWKTVRGEDGRFVRMRTLNADSESFAGDLLSAFKSNVRTARRKNKQAAAE